MSPDDPVLTYEQAVSRLQTGLTGHLPGPSAHRWLEPGAGRRWPAGFNAADARSAAGLLLVFPQAGRAHIVLTERTHLLGRHSGQVSLPGGVVEPGETFEEAALREAHEEIGLERSFARIVGALTPLDIPVSGFRLHPVVAAADMPPVLRAAEDEVARILELSIEGLMTPGRVVDRSMYRDGQRYERPTFVSEGAEIWGATAMVLAEFLAVLGWRGPEAAASAASGPSSEPCR